MKSPNELGIRCPSKISWRIWSFDEHTYEKSFNVQNISQSVVKLDVLAPGNDSSFTFNSSTTIKLFPGMTTSCKVAFDATKEARLNDSILFRCGNASFRVALEATLQQSRIMVPHSVSFGVVAVNESEKRKIRVANVGTTQVSGTWSCDTPFSVDSNQLDLAAGKEDDITITFSPKEAAAYSQFLALHCEDETYNIKVAGVAKYSLLKMSNDTVDFGTVSCSEATKDTIYLKNLGPVCSSFSIARVEREPDTADGINVTPSNGRLKPGESMPLTVTYNPNRSGMRLFERFEIRSSSARNAYITLKANVPLNDIDISCPCVDFGNVHPTETAEREVLLRNRSLEQIRFQLVDANCGPFAVHPSSGTLERNALLSLKVLFQPRTSAVYHREVFVLIQNGLPLSFDLCGTCDDLGQRPKELLSDASAFHAEEAYPSNERSLEQNEMFLEKESLTKRDVWNRCFASNHCSDTLEASASCLNFGSTSRSKDMTYKMLTITNRAAFSQRVCLSVSSPLELNHGSDVCNAFKISPIEKELKAGEESTFHIGFKPEQDGLYFACQCDVHSLSKDSSRSPTANPTLSIQLIANSFLYLMEPPSKQLHFSQTEIHFPASCVAECAYTDMLITNEGNESAFLEFQCLDQESFTLRPRICIVPPQSSQLVCFQFKPTSPGAFEATLLCIVNNHSSDPRTLTMKAEAYEPNITILGHIFHSSMTSDVIPDSKGSSLAFRPTVVGRSSTRVATMKNNTGIATSYKWQFPEQRKEESFTLDQMSGVLSPWEIKKQVFKFSPRTQGIHDISVRCFIGSSAEHLCENNNTWTLCMKGEGVFRSVGLSPKVVQADTIKVFHPFKMYIEVENSCSDCLDYELEATLDTGPIPLANYNSNVSNLIDTSQVTGHKLMLEKPNGTVPPWSSQRLVMVLWCYTPQTLQFYIRDKMNNQINRSLENASIQFCCKAYHPGVVVSDVFSSELSKKMLWHLMNLDKLNRILQESVSMQDIQNSQILKRSLDPFDLDAFPSVTFDFGKHHLNSKEHTVVFELLNNRDIPVSWQLKTFSPNEEQLDAWVEPLTARNPEEESGNFILENNIFKWNMKSGQLPPKQRQTLVMCYNPLVEGKHSLSVCLEVIDGKKIRLMLQGSTSREWKPELILAPYLQLGTVPIGCTYPPVHQLALHNSGTCTANYELHLEELLRLNEENDFEVFTLLGNEKGEVESKMTIPLPIVFNPIEEKKYQVELPITVNGSRLNSITLKGKGTHPKHISKEQQTIEEIYDMMPDASYPVQTDEDRKHLMSGLIRVSTQILSFGVMQAKRTYRRLVEITNQSECSLVYEVDSTNFASISQGQLRVVPDYSLLEPNASQDILLEYNPSEHSEIFASDICMKVTTNPAPPNEVTSEGTTEEILAIHPLPIAERERKDSAYSVKRLPVHLSSTVSFRRRFEHLEMKHKDLSLQHASEDDAANNNMHPRTESIILQLVGEVQCGLSTSKNNIKEEQFPCQDVDTIVANIVSSILEEDNIKEILSHPQPFPSLSRSSPETKTSESVNVFIDEIIRSVLSETT